MATTDTLPADDAALVQRARDGDQEAFGQLFEAHHAAVFRLIFTIVRHERDAQEVTQDLWVSVWQQLAQFRGDAKFTTWLHTIAVRRAIDHLRKRRRWYDRLLPFRNERDEPDTELPAAPEPADPAPHARESMEQSEQAERFERLLASLPPHHRTVLALREVQGLSYEEIANLTNTRPGTVMSRLFHARRLLARQLKDLPCDRNSS